VIVVAGVVDIVAKVVVGVAVVVVVLGRV